MIKYRIDKYSETPEFRISKVEIEKETDTSVWIRGMRNNKHSSFHNYFDTWKEAHEYILGLANNNVNRAILQLERAKGLLLIIYGLKEEK